MRSPELTQVEAIRSILQSAGSVDCLTVRPKKLDNEVIIYDQLNEITQGPDKNLALLHSHSSEILHKFTTKESTSQREPFFWTSILYPN